MNVLNWYKEVLRLTSVNLKKDLLVAGSSILFLSFLLGPREVVWATIVIISFVLLRPIRELKRLYLVNRIQLPLNVLLFSLVCRLGGSVYRALWFAFDNTDEKILKRVLLHLISRSLRGKKLEEGIEEIRGEYEKRIGKLLLEAYRMSFKEHPYSILKMGGEEYRRSLLAELHSLETKKALISATCFFLPIFLTSLVSPSFTVASVILTTILMILLFECLYIVMVR